MRNDFAARFGPWALVTGATSGIGLAFAEALGAHGLGVVLVARRAEALAEVAARLHAAHGTATRVVAADLGERAAAAHVLARVADLDLGLLVAAAGFGAAGPFLADDVDVAADMVDVNCRAVLQLSHGMGRRLAARGRGGMVLLSSLVGFHGVPLAANYAATKAYVQSLAEALHVELAPRGIAVVACAPGPVHSGFGARAGMRMTRADRPAAVAASALARLGRAMTVRPGRLGKLLGWSLATLPRGVRVRLMRTIMAGMAGEAKS